MLFEGLLSIQVEKLSISLECIFWCFYFVVRAQGGVFCFQRRLGLVGVQSMTVVL